MATDHNFRIKNGLEVGGQLIVNSSGQLVVSSVSSQLQFLDNVKAKFGNGSDLQIYHDGSHSRLVDSGTGNFIIQAAQFRVNTSNDAEAMIKADVDGAVTLYYDGAARLATSSGGIDITTTGNNTDIILSEGGSNTDARIRNSNGILQFDADLNNEYGNSSIEFKVDGSTKAQIDRNGRLYLSGTTANYQTSDGNYLRNTTAFGYIQIGPGNAAHAHFLTDRSNFYFNKQIQVDTGIITSHNEDLILRRAQDSGTGQLTLSRGKFSGGSQTATDLLNSSTMIGGFHANSAFEEAHHHFYIPGLSPNQLAGSHRRHTLTVTKNGTAQSGDFSNMFSANGVNTSFSHAAGSTDTIVITITGIAMSYGQHVGVQFGHPTFRAKDIDIEVTTDNGANWTSVYDVTNFPYASVAHYHGGSGTATNGIRYTFTNFNNTGMRINQLFCYDYSENEIYFAERNQDQTIRGNWTWPDNYKAKFGSSDDLQIYHSGTHSFIQDTGVGSLYLDTSGLIVRNPSNNANVLIATPTDVQLFAGGGTAKLQTASWGVLVNGILNADGLHIGTGASDLISVRNDSTTTQIATYRNELGGFVTRTYGDHGNDGTLVEYQERVGADGNYASIGTHGAHALQIRTGNTNRLNISSTGNVEVQGTAHLIAPTIRLTNNGTDTAAHRVSVYDSGTTSYGMMLWNDSGTTGDWATMIYGPDQSDRKISFGKINNTTSFTNHSHVDEIAYFDLDNQNLYLTDGTLFATGTSDGVVGRKGAFGPSQTGLHGTYDLYNNGTTYLNGTTIVDAALTVTDASSGIKVDSSGHASIRMDRGGVSSHNNLLYYTNGTLDWRIWQSNATHLRIRDEGDYPSNMMSFQSATAAGNSKVGIHTDSPEFPVHIQGSVDGDFNVGIFNTKSYGTGTGTNETATLSLGIKEASTTAASRIFGQIRVATLAESDSSTGKMTFNVRSSGSVVERAILDHSGNFTVDGTLIGSTVNTGQGATEVHLMNQNLRTTDSPTFATLNVTGDLNITGDINTVTVNDLDVQDKTITVAAGAASSSAADEAGLIIGGAGSKILWDHAEDKFQFSHGINFDRDTYSETNQNLGVYWSAWDKESGGDKSDKAYIRHTENVGGHSNSVLELKSGNDSGDGIAFTTHASSTLKHNSSNILTVANFSSNITNLLTTTTTFGGDVDGTYNSLVIDVPTQTSAPTASTGRLWWDSNSGNLKIYNGSVWVTASAIPDVSTKYDKTGGAISGSVSITSTLAVSGTITGSSTIQGSTIVKTGGTSSQFLKADGSVDSSTYVTGNQTITLTGDASGSGTTTIPVVVANDSHNHSSSSGNFSVGGTLFVPQKIEHTGDSNTYMEFDSGDQWRVVTGGVERIRVIGGAVGIGDIDPTDGDLTLNTPQLHVKGPDTANKFNLVARFQGGSDSDNTGGAILINHSNDRGLLIEGGRSSSDRGVGYIGLLNSGADHTRIMGFYQDGTTYTAGINIDPGTYPHTDLQVGNPETASTGITIASRYDQASAKLTFRSGHPTTTNVWNTSQITSTDDGNYNGRLEFKTSNSGQAAPSTKMFIRANGNVGIGSGVFTPNSLLDVNGTLTANNLTLQNLSAQNSEATAVMINGSGIIGTRELGSNAFNSTAFLTGNQTITLSGDATGSGTTSINVTVANDSHNHTRFDVSGITDLNSVSGASNTRFRPFVSSFQASNRSGSNYNGGFEVGTGATNYGSQLVFEANAAATQPKFRNKINGTWGAWQSLFADGYHPNADKWTTARSHTVTLTGEVTGTATQSVDGTGNKTWTINTTVGNTSLDDQYVDVTGDTMTGQLVLNNNIASPGNYYNALQMEVRATSGTAGIGLHRNGYSHVGIYHDTSNRLDIDFNGGDVIINHDAGTLLGTGNYTSTLDGRYFTETEADARFINVTGDTATGIHEVDGRWHFNPSTNSSYREGIRLNRSTTGWGGAVFGGVRDSIDGITEAWWVARNPSKNLVLAYGTSVDSGGLLLTHNNTTMKYKNQRVFMDDYHPNADKWTTARSHTVTLTGEVTGTATQSVDGTGNKTWSIAATINNDSLNDQYVQQLPDLTSGAPNYQTPSSRRVDPNTGNPTNEHYAVMTYGNGGNVTGQLATHFQNGSTYNRAYNNSWSAWSRMFDDDYHPNADTWTATRTDTVTLTGDATGTASASVNGSGNWTNSIAVNVNNIDGQAFINTRSNSAQSVQGVDGNGIFYYTSGTDNFSGNATDGAGYAQSHSTSWRHTINGDYRSGAIAVKSRNAGTWQETKRIPMIFTGSTTPTITTHADNCELWFDTSVGKLKFYHNDGTTAAWVDAVAVPSISNLYSKGGGTISGSVSISNTLNVVGITELDNELFVDKIAGANGTSNQIARFSNIASGATSGYIYLGASAGTDWKVGKNVAGTSGSSQFDIATHTNVLALSVNTSRGIIAHTGAIHSDTNFAFLTVGSGAQNIRTKSVFAGTSYGDTPPAGSFNATNTYEQNGTTVIDASKNLQNIAAINLSGQINFNGTTYKSNPYEQSVYRGGTTTSQASRRGLNFYHSSGPQSTIWYSTSTGQGSIKIYSSATSVGDMFKLDANTANLDIKGNITAYSTATTSDARLKENVRDLEGSLDKTLKLRGVKFDWIAENKANDQVGFIAQEVEEVLPEVVIDHIDIDDNDVKVVNYQAVVPVLVEAIKEQQSLINRLEARLNDLEKSMEKK